MGDCGEALVNRYPFYATRERCGYFRSLTFLGDSELRHPDQETPSLRRAVNRLVDRAMQLFVVADVGNAEDVRHAVHFARRHKNSTAARLTTLIALGGTDDEYRALRDTFDLVIAADADDVSELIDLLISGLYVGMIGYDGADIMNVLQNTSVMHCARYTVATAAEREDIVVALRNTVTPTEPQNAICYFAVPLDFHLDDVLEICEELFPLAGGDILWQLDVHPDEQDTSFSLTLLCGACRP